jgi:alginate O-acetyltransferase complex protein AlgI
MAFMPVYILILGFTIVIDYFAGIWIEQANQEKKKQYLVISIVANVGILCVFKYYNFFIENVEFMLTHIGVHYDNLPYLNILLPLGLSFHTFQAMSYTIEVYRGNQKAERHFGIYSLYVMFYPQLVAGPIERPQNVLHQFHEEHKFNYSLLKEGIFQMGWGLFKKAVIADRLSIIVDNVYNSPESYQGLSLLIATIFFAFQIYCDFSGYSDIALGAAKTMGFDLMKNFDKPYFAKSISDFWRRWHISLSRWFRDYVYIPLGGNKVSKSQHLFNLFITFLLSGLWHGASWTFIIWGALHGIALAFDSISKKSREFINGKTPSWLYNSFSLILTFSFVCITYVFFRANSVKGAFYIIDNLASVQLQQISDLIYTCKSLITQSNDVTFHSYSVTLGSDKQAMGKVGDIFVSFIAIAFLVIIEWIGIKKNIVLYFSQKPTLVKYTFYSIFMVLLISFAITKKVSFIYFQF